MKVGACPKCGGRVLDVGNERVPFLCEHNRTPAPQEQGAGQSCDFRLYREFLGKKLTKAEVKALLGGETATLKGLVSKKTGERFDAFVALDPEQGHRPRITGYPPMSEATAKANAKAREAARKAAEKEARRPSNQASLPGLEW